MRNRIFHCSLTAAAAALIFSVSAALGDPPAAAPAGTAQDAVLRQPTSATGPDTAVRPAAATTVTGGTLRQPPTVEEMTPESVQARLKQSEETPELDETLKVKIRELNQQTLQELEVAKTWEAKATRFQQMAEAAPEEMERARATLAVAPTRPKVAAPDEDLTLVQLEQAISKKEGELNEARAALADLEAEPKRRASRRVEIPKAISAAKDRLADVERQLQAAPPADEPAALTTARRLLLAARKRGAEAEIRTGEREIAAHEALAEVLPLRRDMAARQVGHAEYELKQWRETVNRRRQKEAEEQVRRARLEATQAHPAVRKLAQDNAQLAEMREGLAQHIAETTQQLEQARQRLATLKDQFKRVQEKVEAAGPTNAIGLLLRKQRDVLPNLDSYRRNLKSRQAAIREGQLALFQLEDRRSELANPEKQVRAMLQELDPAGERSDRQEIRAALRELLKAEKEYLDGLIGDHNSYFDKLVDLDNAERQLIQEAEACGRYIDERVLWIGSAPMLGLSDLRQASGGLWWLVQPEGWREVGSALVADAWSNPGPPLVLVLVLAGLVRCRGRIRRRLAEIGEQAQRANCYHFVPTLRALVLTLLMPLVVPLLLGYASWRLTADVDATEWCRAVGAGLASVARVYFVFELLRQVCRPGGLGEAHFGWNGAGLKALRAQIRWFLLACLPLAFLVAAMGAQDNDRWRDSIGRLSFIAGAITFSVFLQRALRPDGSVFAAVLDARRGGWLDRLRYVWYPLVVLHPLVLAAAAGAGYYYTSQQIGRRIFFTISLLLGLMLLRAVLLRWALVNRRKLAIGEARRRAAAQAEAAAGEAPPENLPAPPDPHRDLATINSQTRRLIEYSLALAGILAVWLIWVDTLPALRILNRVPLWQTVVNTTETVRGPDGAATLRNIDKLAAITLADLALAMLVLATTLIAAKNIPGLLEMALLQHVPLDAGIRYAVATVSRYVITIVGVLLACNTIGLSWSKVQWLLAAIGVGLGFGLQEIFANFISGLIILFERPVRVGDVITVDNITGIVSRIRMRATTITNWDRKELIIPNKEFITGRVLNWTLSDQVNRIVVNVSIALGSDAERAGELLLRIAKEHPLLLSDPPPTVAFEGFGDSAKKFVLCCFLPNLENRTVVIHELHMAIDRAFRAAGIEIAYPQQDVHVRSIDIPTTFWEAVVGRTAPALQVTGEDGQTRRVA